MLAGMCKRHMIKNIVHRAGKIWLKGAVQWTSVCDNKIWHPNTSYYNLDFFWVCLSFTIGICCLGSGASWCIAASYTCRLQMPLHIMYRTKKPHKFTIEHCLSLQHVYASSVVTEKRPSVPLVYSFCMPQMVSLFQTSSIIPAFLSSHCGTHCKCHSSCWRPGPNEKRVQVVNLEQGCQDNQS